ncbi:MAG: hypothetical protein J6K43_10720 [Lachnospiraceae bacterium]|nr:hypothetical protein [Lachnospiraceae bacterium]
MYKELKYLIGGSSVIIIALVGMMFFSPLSSQFTDDSVSRGSSWEMDVDELINTHQTDRALNFVDSLIEVKSQDLPRFAYFDRYLSEDERMDVAIARADIYELQWKRIELLKATYQVDALRDALEDYVDVIGYNQEAAESMLKQLNNK